MKSCCFTCFTASKSKHNKRIHILNRDVAALTPPLQSTTLQIPFPLPRDKKLEEEQLNFHFKVLSPEEAVTDKVGEIEVKIRENEQESSHPKYQPFSKQQFHHAESRNLVEEESSESLFSLSIDSRRRKSGGGAQVTSFDEALSPDKVGENEVKMGENQQEPSNLNYQPYSNQLLQEDGRILVEAESSESLFSLSIDSRKLISCGGDLGEKEVSSQMPKCSTQRNQNQTQSVLTPLENQNLPQLKTVKAKLHHQDKENINSQQDNTTNTFSFELLSKKERANHHEKKLSGKEIAVETSLSNWLIDPDTAPLPNGGGASSPTSTQSRHILGVLTVRQCLRSTTTQTRRNSLSSDDTSNVGTVGSYRRLTGGRVDSDSSASSRRMLENVTKDAEDKRKKWNSGPFEERLDRALDKIVAKV